MTSKLMRFDNHLSNSYSLRHNFTYLIFGELSNRIHR